MYQYFLSNPNDSRIGTEWVSWYTNGGLAGLVLRRQAEYNIYSNGVYEYRPIAQVNQNGIITGIADSSDWKIETDNSTWKITNVGVDSSVVWRYIYSLDKKIKDKSFAQNVPLENVAKQNLKDSIYSSLWFKQLKVSDDSLFLRSDSRTIHPYLKSKYDSIKKVFEISKNQIPLNSRIEEIATIRGRVPGENQKHPPQKPG